MKTFRSCCKNRPQSSQALTPRTAPKAGSDSPGRNLKGSEMFPQTGQPFGRWGQEGQGSTNTSSHKAIKSFCFPTHCNSGEAEAGKAAVLGHVAGQTTAQFVGILQSLNTLWASSESSLAGKNDINLWHAKCKQIFWCQSNGFSLINTRRWLRLQLCTLNSGKWHFKQWQTSEQSLHTWSQARQNWRVAE